MDESIDWGLVGDEVSGYLQDLIRIDTTNPPGNEGLAARYIADVLEREGYTTTLSESAPGRGNVTTRLAGGPQRLRAGVVGHRWRDAALGGQHNSVAQPRPGGEYSAEEFLAGPEPAASPVEAVDVGVVDQVHAQVDGRLDQAGGCVEVIGCVAPQAEGQRSDRRQAASKVAWAGLD